MMLTGNKWVRGGSAVAVLLCVFVIAGCDSSGGGATGGGGVAGQNDNGANDNEAADNDNTSANDNEAPGDDNENQSNDNEDDDDVEVDAGPGELAVSEKQRITSPDVPDEDLADLVGGNSTFAFEMYQEVRADDRNILFSPFSISTALAMTYAGARTVTEAEMADVLNFDLPQDRLHPAFNALDLELADRGSATSGQDGADETGEDGEFRLNIVNRLWGQVGYEFLAPFLDLLAENYGAAMNLLDFAADPEAARIIINDWVAEVTEGRIEDLIPPGVIDGSTVLVLTNAIFFKASWSLQFDEVSTQDGTFNLLDSTTATTPMMRQTEVFAYAAGDGYQAVELPYEGEDFSMVLLVPDAGRYEEIESGLGLTVAEAVVDGLAFEDVVLTMPRFSFEWEQDLSEILIAMGMPSAFGAADFSGMHEGGGLQIQAVVHKAFIAVDEEGTEAAAATAVIIGEGAAAEPENPVVLTIDRPFIFWIRDIETGTILFLGRVLDPTG